MNAGRPADHRGRVTTPSHDVSIRPRKRAVVWTAWLIVAGLVLAVAAPVVALLFS